jgi:hypothetical protein
MMEGNFLGENVEEYISYQGWALLAIITYAQQFLCSES